MFLLGHTRKALAYSWEVWCFPKCTEGFWRVEFSAGWCCSAGTCSPWLLKSCSLCFPKEVWSDQKYFPCHLASLMKHLLHFRHTFNVYWPVKCLVVTILPQKLKSLEVRTRLCFPFQPDIQLSHTVKSDIFLWKFPVYLLVFKQYLEA